MAEDAAVAAVTSRPKSVMVPVIFERDELAPEVMRGVFDQQPPCCSSSEREPPLTTAGEKCYACIVSKEDKPELASALQVITRLV